MLDHNKFAAFHTLKKCGVCHMRSCDQKGYCDPNAGDEYFIMRIADFLPNVTLEDCLKAPGALTGRTEEKVGLLFYAAKVLHESR